MLIHTSRFGEVDVDQNRIMKFPKGLLGFPDESQYVLLDAGQDSYFWWLQSIEFSELAFVVTDPSYFVPTFKVPIRVEQMNELGISSLDEAQVFVVVNKRDSWLTGNLQGPLVVNVASRTGEQLVLSDRLFTTRVPLIELGNRVQAVPA